MIKILFQSIQQLGLEWNTLNFVEPCSFVECTHYMFMVRDGHRTIEFDYITLDHTTGLFRTDCRHHCNCDVKHSAWVGDRSYFPAREVRLLKCVICYNCCLIVCAFGILVINVAGCLQNQSYCAFIYTNYFSIF